MGFKKTNQFWLIQNGVMTGVTTLTSANQFVGNLDNIGIEFAWTGTPTGTLNVNGSVSAVIPHAAAVGYYPMTFSPALQNPAGSATGFILSLQQFPWPYFNVTYTNVSGTGVLNVYYFSKDLN